MNNTCCIAAGHLGALLANQRADWDFATHRLTPTGRAALWYITDKNDTVASISVASNDLQSQDIAGLARAIATCSSLQRLNLSDNQLRKLTTGQADLTRVCTALATSSTLADLNLSKNQLGQAGTRIVARALRTCVGLKRLGYSFNEPGVEPSFVDLFRYHPALVSIELVEATDRHLPSRMKDDIGRAVVENKARTLSFLHCDMFVLSEETKSLLWSKEASTSDAMLLAGPLSTNTTLTTFNVAQGATLSNAARAALGGALLNNPGSAVAFCNDFGLHPNVDTCEFDLSRVELKDVEPFSFLAGCLRGNRTLTHVTLRQLRMEQIETLALALRGNETLHQLDIIHTSRLQGQSAVRLPVPDLNGLGKSGKAQKCVNLSKTCLEGNIGRVACALIGVLTVSNTVLECLDLSNTGVGLAIAAESDGGHALLRPLCESKLCPLHRLNLSNIELNDKAGAKLISALATGMYDNITSLGLASNDLGKLSGGAALKQLLWGERAPCMLQSLNLSANLNLDGADIVAAIKRNESLTSIDFTKTPSANTEDVFSSLGTFLLQPDCMCRLGLLSCDAFTVSEGQSELALNALGKEGTEKHESEIPRVSKGVMALLAGVLKFNSTLQKLTLSETGFDSESAHFFATSLLSNTVLQHLDVSSNCLSADGAQELSDVVHTHRALEMLRFDGTPLSISSLKGTTKGTGSTLIDVAGWLLGPLSGFAIGTIARHNRCLASLNLRSNAFGADGLTAIAQGLAYAPLKVLDITGTCKDGAESSEIQALCISLCRNLGMLVELRMNENNFNCPATALIPLCKLRSLRTLSLEKNRLSALPSLISTMVSLRRLFLHSNFLYQLPDAICLLHGLEILDVHKNVIANLPLGVGKLRNLHKLDISENKLTELPVTICELSEEMQLVVSRNPLEKPSVEQARQGIGAIRRYFNYSRSRAGDDSGELTAENAVLKVAKDDKSKSAGDGRVNTKRPAKQEGSRHDWAGPGDMVVLFNCFDCSVDEMEGGSDLNLLPPNVEAELFASFNLQCIGRVRPAHLDIEPFANRVEFHNEWLPWRNQALHSSNTARLIVQVTWKGCDGVKGVQTLLLVQPWLAYGCSVGSRVKTTAGFSTVVCIHDDDTCDIICDNAKDGIKTQRIDARPDTVTRTTSPSYKAGQKLAILLDGVPTDAIVEDWLGIRRGSRHCVRTGGQGGKGSSKGNRSIFEMDLNEDNHALLLFSTVARYDAARMEYCNQLLLGKHSVAHDDATGRDLTVLEQRIFLRPSEALNSEEEGQAGEQAQSDVSADTLFKNLIDASPPPNILHRVTLIRAVCREDSDLLVKQALLSFAASLCKEVQASKACLVPLTFPMQRMAEHHSDDQTVKQGLRARIIKALESEHPDQSDIFKQGLDMKSLIIVMTIRNEAELALLTEGLLYELQANYLILICSTIGEEGVPLKLPTWLTTSCALMHVSSMSLSLSESKLTNRAVGNLFRRIFASISQALPSHYSIVSRIHLSYSDMSGDAMLQLQGLLMHDDCSICYLDLSYTKVTDCFPLVQALRSNCSLTSLDMRFVPAFKSFYEALASVMLNPDSLCRLSSLRCDAFEMIEGETALSLREKPLEPAVVQVIAGLLTCNSTLHDLDLTATEIESCGASAIAAALKFNSALTALRLMYNPALEEKDKMTLTTAAQHKTSLRIEL